ncbi:hypothetical protein D9M70_405120 [compost metagenome]
MSAYLLFIGGRGDIFDCSLSFLFFSIFFPVLSLFWVEHGDISYLLFCSLFWLVLFLTLSFIPAGCAFSLERNGVNRIESFLDWVYLAVILMAGVLLLLNFSISSGVGFDSVYERRKVFSEWLAGGFATYLYTWSVYVFATYLIFISRRRFFNLIGVAYVLIFYAVAGDKVYLFLIGLIFFLRVASLRGGAALLLCAFIFLSLSGVVFFFVLGDVWVPAIVNRFLVLPADISFNYVKYFQGGELFYAYSFMSLFVDYEYSSFPAQLIGSVYYADGDNANVNFLADAYVNLGWFSIVPLLFFFVVLRAVFLRGRYVILLAPIFVQAINMPLPTLLLTGGGALMIVGCYMLSGSAALRKGRFL